MSSSATQTGNVYRKAAIPQKPVVNLLSYLKPIDNISLAAFEVFYQGLRNPAAVAAGIEELFNNNVTVIPGSLKETVSNQRLSKVTARVTGKVKRLAFEPSESASAPDGFVSVSKNLFMDNEQQMWKLNSTGGRTFLVREDNVTSDSALDELLSNFAPATAGFKVADDLISDVHSLAAALETGTLVSYVQPTTKQVKIGFILECSGDKATLVPEIGAIEKVSISHLVRGFDLAGYQDSLRLPKGESVAGISSREDLVAFYRQVYGMNETFFADFQRTLQAAHV